MSSSLRLHDPWHYQLSHHRVNLESTKLNRSCLSFALSSINSSQCVGREIFAYICTMENVSTIQMMSEHVGRWLDDPSSVSDEEMLRNRILYIAYLCVLGCCCVTPCLYYIRVSAWQRRQFREFREMERNTIIAALAQSTTNSNHRMNTSAELAIVQSERRARILQLMEPVRMVRRINLSMNTRLPTNFKLTFAWFSPFMFRL